MTILNAQTNSGASVPVKYRRDHHQRRNLCFDEQSFQHPAKTNLNWLGRLLHLYTETHQIVLDPFGGSGSILLATYTGRQVITGDVEAHLAQLLNQNALRIRSKSLFSAPAQVARWDAGHLPLADNSIPVIITSPPYFDTFSTWNAKSGNQLTHNPGPTGSCYGFDPRQIANVHVYETYLRIMAQVYRECRRVLCPSGTLLLILGDKIHKGRVVPITADTETLCTAMGFTHTTATSPPSSMALTTPPSIRKPRSSSKTRTTGCRPPATSRSSRLQAQRAHLEDNSSTSNCTGHTITAARP